MVSGCLYPAVHPQDPCSGWSCPWERGFCPPGALFSAARREPGPSLQVAEGGRRVRVPAFSPAPLPALPVGLFTRGQLPASLLPCLCSCPFLPKHDGRTSAGRRGCSLQDPRGKRPAYRSGVLDLNSGFMSSRLPACRGTPLALLCRCLPAEGL